MAEISAELGLELKEFLSGIQKAQTSAGKFGKSGSKSASGFNSALNKVGKTLTRLGGGLKAVAASAIRVGAVVAGIGAAAAAGLAVGIKGALDAGGALSDLSSRTGIAVGSLVRLEQAFKDNGLEAEKVGTTINKMQKAISDLGNGLSTQVRAFDALGLSFDDIKNLSPEEQFNAIQKAISGIENPTKRAGVAMEIFGRSGGELLTLFSDKGAMSNAATVIGGQADILEKNAASFDRSADILASSGAKMRGFFVGVAAQVNGSILPLLERWNAMDFSSQGLEFGKHLQAALGEAVDKVSKIIALYKGAFENGNLKELLSEQFKGGMTSAAQVLTDALANPTLWITAGDLFGAAAKGALTSLGVGGREKDLTIWEKEQANADFEQFKRDMTRKVANRFDNDIELSAKASRKMTGDYGNFVSMAKPRETITGTGGALASMLGFGINQAINTARGFLGGEQEQEKRFAGAGRLAGATNLIAGRSANAVIAIEAQKTNNALDKANNFLKIIADNSKKDSKPVQIQALSTALKFT